MPISQYNHYFTKDPKAHADAAQKVHDNLIKEYGQKKGEQIFYSMINQRKSAKDKALQKRAKGNGSQDQKK